jgi:pilus assembly protein Flp/PilA
MKTYLRKIVAFINDEEGASAIEYGLLVGLIALAIVAGATLLGTSISNMFSRASVKLDAYAT